MYLGLIEVVFLTAFFSSVSQVARSLADNLGADPWTNLVVYGGVVAFHWWVASREPPGGDAAELPRLLGSGVSLVALAIGLGGVLRWLFERAYESIFSVDLLTPSSLDDVAVATGLALLVTGGAIWAWRWLPVWDEEPSVLRSIYLAGVAVVALGASLGAGIAIVTLILSYFVSSDLSRRGTLRFAAHIAVDPHRRPPRLAPPPTSHG